ncbi:tRNAHis guanylyltransferase-domain-containing protein [Hyaloraphidium curvatum]|nr:tRNAHis guanylyltransferase-domain-containing protein [Hyaloraphidium curvatum]
MIDADDRDAIFEYVKLFERSDALLPNTWIVVRVDGRSFHRFTTLHGFAKPNDPRGLRLMVDAARHVMREIKEVTMGYGESDEFSFLLPPSTDLYQRRESKLTSAIVSLFTSSYVFRWPHHFDRPLEIPPSFDGRAVCYPDPRNVRDYFSWRQADTHINNLYNTCLWNLVRPPATARPGFAGEMTTQEASRFIADTAADSAKKNELLFSRFGMNYNDEPAMFRKGTTLYYRSEAEPPGGEEGGGKRRAKAKRGELVDEAVDIIGDTFWDANPYLLAR